MGLVKTRQFAAMQKQQRTKSLPPNLQVHSLQTVNMAAPEYTDWGNAVKVTVRRFQKKIDIGPEKSDIGAEKRLPEVGELDIGAGKLDIGDGVDTVNGPVKGPVNGPERLFVIIKLNPGLRKTALAELSGISARTVKRYVETFLTKRIEFRGAPKTGGYYCKE